MVQPNFSLLDDNALIAIVKEFDDPAAYKELFNRYHHKILDKCFSLVHNRELAGELAQSIISKVFEKLKSFEGRSSFSSWVYSITYNYCIDYLRRKKKLHYPDWNRTNIIPEYVDDIEEDVTEENYERLMSIMDEIHPEEKALLLMKYQENFSHREIGESLQISESATKMRIKRARARVLYLYQKRYLER